MTRGEDDRGRSRSTISWGKQDGSYSGGHWGPRGSGVMRLTFQDDLWGCSVRTVVEGDRGSCRSSPPTFPGLNAAFHGGEWSPLGEAGRVGPSLRPCHVCFAVFFAFIYFFSLLVSNCHRPFACALQTQSGVLASCCRQNSPDLVGLRV